MSDFTRQLVRACHPDRRAIPADVRRIAQHSLLAQAEAQALPGHRLISAFVAGVEFQSRLAAVFGESHYARGWHNTATLGTFGAAFASGVLLHLSEEQLVTALGVAASFASAPRLQFGSDAKALQCGAAACGLYAARLAQRGVTAHPAIFDPSSGYIELMATDFSRRIDPARWFTRDIVYKYHASCYGTQAPITAAQAVSPGAIPDGPIHVWTEPQYLSVCNIASPTSLNAARFSVRHMVAVALLRGDTVSEAGLRDTLDDASVAALRDRISVEGDASLPRASARIVFGNGFTRYAEMNKPERDHERQLKKLEQKSARLLAEHFSDAQITSLHQRIRDVDSALPVTTLCEMLSPV